MFTEDTHQLARLDAPAHLAENHHRLRRQLRLDPAGRTDRQDMLRKLDRPVDLAVDDQILAPLDLALNDDALPYRGDALGDGRSAGALSARRRRTGRSFVSKLRLEHL